MDRKRKRKRERKAKRRRWKRMNGRKWQKMKRRREKRQRVEVQVKKEETRGPVVPVPRKSLLHSSA